MECGRAAVPLEQVLLPVQAARERAEVLVIRLEKRLAQLQAEALVIASMPMALVSVKGDRSSQPVDVSGVDRGLPGFGDTQITKNLQQLLAAGRAPH